MNNTLVNNTLAALFFRNRKAFRPRPLEHEDDRHLGTDLAWFISLLVFVTSSFSVMLGGGFDLNSVGAFLWMLQGQGAAALLVMAGIGAGRVSGKRPVRLFPQVTRRAAVLLAVGLLASFFFAADLLRYGAFITLAGALFARTGDGIRWTAILMISAAYVILRLSPASDPAWLWAVNTEGLLALSVQAVRDVLFTGWYPLMPWLVFFLIGLSLAGLDLKRPQAAFRLIVAGLTGAALAYGLHDVAPGAAPAGLSLVAAIGDQLLAVEPIFLLSGTAGAFLVLGGSLVAVHRYGNSGLLVMMARAGRHSLTLYLAHLIIARVGIWIYEALYGYEPYFLTSAQVLLAMLMFGFVAMVYADLWARYFKHGPLEGLLSRFG